MQADPGSFRDPDNQVLFEDGRVFRRVSAASADEMRSVLSSDFFQRAVARGDVVGTTLRSDDDTGLLLEHEYIGHFTYPAEWTFSMMRSAALLQLRLTAEALAEGFITKDATPYNVVFVGTTPRFIDVGSFERYRDGEPWAAYRQFCSMFLYPMMMTAYAGMDFQPLLRGSIEGISPATADSILSGTRRLRKGVPVHVALLSRAETALDDGSSSARDESKAAGMSREIIVATVTKLIALVERMDWRQADSEWSSYSDRSHYGGADLDAKAAFVAAASSRVSGPATVWDVGCNDGHFSRLVAAPERTVLAIDLDHLVVDLLYRNIAQHPAAGAVIPVVADLCDPPPGIGWRNVERPAFVDRNRPDLLLALAVVHHMAITATVPLGHIVDLFADLADRCVIEFPTPDDQMVKRLLRNKRAGQFAGYQLDVFEAELARRFDVVERVELMGGDRIMFEVVSRRSS